MMPPSIITCHKVCKILIKCLNLFQFFIALFNKHKVLPLHTRRFLFISPLRYKNYIKKGIKWVFCLIVFVIKCYLKCLNTYYGGDKCLKKITSSIFLSCLLLHTHHAKPSSTSQHHNKTSNFISILIRNHTFSMESRWNYQLILRLCRFRKILHIYIK